LLSSLVIVITIYSNLGYFSDILLFLNFVKIC
jgi:hypothetical protein